MSTIVTRAAKGSPLTHAEVDANFTNLNTDKYQSGDSVTFATLTVTGQSDLGFDGSNNQTFRANAGTGAFPWVQSTHASGSARLRAVPTAGSAELWLSSTGTSAIRFYTQAHSNEQFRVAHTASAVNYVQVTGAATGTRVAISAQGSDTNVGFNYYAKGNGNHNFWTNNGSSRHFSINHTTGTIVNWAAVTGSTTGNSPTFSVEGSDTNIDLALTPKGTGLVRFGTRTATSDVAITGYLEIKDSGGTTRKLAIID